MRYLSALTSLRFFAAAMIVVHHTQGYFEYGHALESTLALDQGVSFFFVLSGFILFYTNRHIASLAEARRFLTARIARIWPLHVTTLLIILLFVPQPWGPSGPAIGPTIANVLLLQAWIPLPGYFFSFNAVSWSLSTEFLFYITFPLLVLNWRRTWPWKIALCATAAASMVWISNAAKLPFYDGSAVPSIDAMVYINPISRIFEFSLGLAAAHTWLGNRFRLDRTPVWLATLLEIGVMVTVFVSMTILKDAWLMAYSRGAISSSLLRWVLSSSTSPFFAVAAMSFAMQRGLLSRILSWRPFVLLGEISFALYMCHELLFRALTSSGTMRVFGPLGAQFVVYWVMALGLSYALFRLVEWPCRRGMLSRLHAGQRHPVAAEAVGDGV